MEAITRTSIRFLAVLAIIFAAAFPAIASVDGSGEMISPAPAPMTSDGTSIDQGVAYVLMLVALVLTYIIH